MMTQPGFEQDTFKILLESYLGQINLKDALQKFRTKAWDHFLELGLPTRQNEEYRYIKLRTLFSHNYQLAQDTTITQDQIAPYIYPECQHSVLVIVNGFYKPQLSNRQAISQKIVISTLEDSMNTYGSFLNNFWAKSLKEETDPFAALNSALHRHGLFIYVPPKTIEETPIQILHIIATENDQQAIVMPRINVFVGSQSQVKIVNSQKPISNRPYFVNQVVELAVEDDAHAHFTQSLCNENPEAWHFDSLRAVIKRNATLKTIVVTEGSKTVRNDYRISLVGENAEALLNGVNMLNGKNEAHAHIFMDHQAPNCRSFQLFKTVLNDFSRASFEGKIMVRQIAQKTEAFQLNNNLLLNDHAHADSKPNLEIFADDVKASHGATVGQLDQDQLFYMTTRGIPDHEAKNLLIYGFCEQVIEMIQSIPSLKNEITQKVNGYLKSVQ